MDADFFFYKQLKLSSLFRNNVELEFLEEISKFRLDHGSVYPLFVRVIPFFIFNVTLYHVI